MNSQNNLNREKHRGQNKKETSNKMSDDFMVNRVVRDASFSMPTTHYHECYEIFYLISGECNMLLNHQLYRIKAGSLIIIPPGDIHKSTYSGNEKRERVTIRFSLEDLSWACEMLGRDYFTGGVLNGMITIPDKRREYVLNIMDRMVFERRQADEMSNSVVKALFQELILFFIRCEKYGEEAVNEVDAENSVIQEVATYIYQNFDKQVYLDEVAEKFHISRSYLSKKFKSTTGFGFKEYLLNVRIKEACQLLLETNQSITEIAFACGFNDSNYFGDAFRRIKGISPNKYRRKRDIV